MDKDELIAILRPFLAQLEAEGYPIEFAGLPPSLPEYEWRLNLQIYSPKFLELGISASLRLIAYRMFDLLSVEVRSQLSRIQICRTPADISCRAEDIIINKIKYRPLTIPYLLLEAA
jgi:hypothetical protein